MATNFVILYTAREGSTAIVDALSRHPEISVPILEELDRFWISKFYGSVDLGRVMGRIFRENTFDLGDDWGFRKFISENKRDRPVACVGFKWRPHGKTREMRRIFREHSVTVFFLCRRDLDELAASLFFSQTVAARGRARSSHAQFEYSTLSEDERAIYRKAFESEPVTLNPLKIWLIMLKRTLKAGYLRYLVRDFRRSGIRARIIHYEDFLATPDRFFDDVLGAVGVARVPAQTLLTGQKIVKVTRVPATERVRGARWLKFDPISRALVVLYRQLTRETSGEPTPPDAGADDEPAPASRARAG